MNVTVTAFPARPGILSAAAIAKATLVTMPPSDTVGPVAAMSVVVATETPVAEPAMGPPMVAPVSVSVIAPAATSAVAVTMYVDAVPAVVVAKLVPTTPIVPLM